MRVTVAAGVLLLWCGLSALAQEPGRRYRVGILVTGNAGTILRHTVPELAREGLVDGKNLTIDIRSGPPSSFPQLARDLVASKPDVIVAVSTLAGRAAKDETSTIPIVLGYGDDPVEEGLVPSMTRSGTNVTGQAMLSSVLNAKRLQLLHEAVPRARRVAVLITPPPRHDRQLAAIRRAAEEANIEVIPFVVASRADYDRAFEAMRQAGVDALQIPSATEFAQDVGQLAELAVASKLPTVCEWSWMAEAGCLLGYGPDTTEMRRRTATYIIRILRGTPPGEIPIEGPTLFRFTINGITAQRLRITLPPTVIGRADEVID